MCVLLVCTHLANNNTYVCSLTYKYKKIASLTVSYIYVCTYLHTYYSLQLIMCILIFTYVATLYKFSTHFTNII